MVFTLILLIGLLIGSALFSGAETALFGLSRYELNQFRRDRRASHRLVAELLRNPRKLLLTLMVGNVTLNMFIFATSIAFFSSIANGRPKLAAALGLISPIMVTLLADLLPKGTAIVLRSRVAVWAAQPTRVAQIVLSPIGKVLNILLVEPMTRLLVGGRRPDQYVTIDELRELVEMAERHRIIDADENAMLGEVVQLSRLKVRDIMVPRVDMVAFELYDDPDELKRILRQRPFDRLPIYEGTIDHIVGQVYTKDVFLNPNSPIKDLLRPIRFVPELITLTQLLDFFRSTKTGVAIVVDEFGGVVGLVTLSAVAEQIVGELTGPEDEDHITWERLDERRYRVSGSLNIRDWAEQFDIRRIDEDVTTVAGLVLARLGRIPSVGDKVRLGNLELTVESMRGRRIDRVLLELINGHTSNRTEASHEQEVAS
ncbi:MAG TPA: hemolysin family protein [Phycisphaerae bacterium]|jgi:putative hemolysin|nr:hemolysin family protein [Phycisphaerae bacterium]HOJ56512.1 hemolysin family protein [Phycisphaerae bacterium]HOL28330.1 hemolysin family protein [Phycisphaerae bacterium]HPP22700.1 hemolysin family protein [Phycisphaerae bacterium]HQA44965.1 hemolysin family protein [Phycisphaerae bacterium]